MLIQKQLNTKFVRKLKKLDNANNNADFMYDLTIIEKNKRNEIKIFSRRCISTIKDGKLSRSEIWTNKYTIKQIKIYSKK